MKIPTNKDVADYYNSHQFIYSIFWSRTALHYGLWYGDTKNLAEAIINTNKFVKEVLEINSNDVVLDAGCGVGGTSMYLAETGGGTKVYGITLSEVQLKIARKRALKSKVSSLLHFSIQDFLKTNFADNTFTKVFGIESICCALNKIDFLNEAYRIMKPGGKIAVVDGYLIKENLNDKEKDAYDKFNQGWRLPNLATKEGFRKDLEKAGFKNIVFHDKLPNIKKSSQIIYRQSLPSYSIEFLKSKLGIGTPNFSGFVQKDLFNGIATYGVFVAEKPE